MTGVQILLAISYSVLGGWTLSAAAMCGMRLTVNIAKRPAREILAESFSLFALYVGGTERAVATVLVLFVPRYLPAFVGGWMALKIAANWGRQKAAENDPEGDRAVRVGHLMALVGSTISFAVAIAVGLIFNPDAIEIWNAVE